MLTIALRILVNNSIKESFYKKNYYFNNFFITYKNNVETFIR